MSSRYAHRSPINGPKNRKKHRPEVERLETRFLPAGSITGIVYRDYDSDGAQDSREPGVSGIVVSAFDANNTLVDTDTSVASGVYNLDIPGATTRVRLEFTGLPNYLAPGPFGAQSGTTVQFVDTAGGAVTANLGLSNPAEYTQPLSDLEILTACYVTGNQRFNLGGTDNTAEVLITIPYTARGTTPGHGVLARANQVGTTYGLAYQRSTRMVFASALMRRHAGFGPAGSGAIYRIDRNTNPPTVTPFLDLNSLGINFFTGDDPHPTAQGTYNPNLAEGGGSPWFRDSASFDLVSKMSLGDLDISEDGRTLYTINLLSRELIAIPLTATGDLGAAPAQRIPIPLTAGNDALNFNNPGDIRPFGLGIKDGIVYVGMVYSAQTTQDRNTLRAYVYSFNPATQTFGNTPVLNFPLNYERGSGDIIGANPSATDPRADWNPWTDTFPFGAGSQFGSDVLTVYAQPILSDISFDNGDMILGFRDRMGDQGAYFAGSPGSDQLSYTIISAGDTLRAAAVGNGTWAIENNGTAGSLVSGGANSGDGPGGGEFYFNDQVIRDITTGAPESFGHQEITLGSILQIPGAPQLAAAAYDAYAGFTGSILWFENVASAGRQIGQNVDGNVDVVAPIPRGLTPPFTLVGGDTGERYQIFDTPGVNGGLPPSPVISKASGLGDLDALADPAPLEIGNRVFLDSNANGLQDAEEPGIAGVTVRLLDASNTQVASVETTATGQYLFNDGNVPGGLVRGANYRVVVAVNQNPLTGLFLTIANAGTNDAIDSDAVLTGNDGVISLVTGADGINNHDYDVGFSAVAPPRTLSLGNLVFFDLNNNGQFESATETGISGVTVRLYRDSDNNGVVDGVQIATTTTNATGHYLFTGLSADTYIVEVVTPANHVSSSGTFGSATGPFEPAPDPDGNTDNDDNGSINGTVVQSGPVTLALDTEPTGEGDTPGLPDSTPDADSNVTVDFGFYRPMSLGNLVFIDTNNDGFRQPNEVGFGDVPVRLLDANGTTTLATTTTDNNGNYLFRNLTPGTYVVEIVRPGTYRSSTGGASLTSGPFEPAPSPENDVDNDDNGTTTGTNIRSLPVTLVLDSEPINDGDSDPNSNLTVDFGLILTEPDTPPRQFRVTSKLQLLASVALRPERVAEAERFVNSLYNDVLLRQADQNGLDHWVFLLLAGTTRAEVAEAFWNSAECRALQVAVYYRQFLRREPDAQGQQFFTNLLLNGMTEAELIVHFVTSPEYLTTHPDAETFLTGLYTDLLGRAPDTAARDFWLPQLADRANWGRVGRDILSSFEASSRIVGQLYSDYLGRTATSAEVALLATQLSSGQASLCDVAVAILQSEEYFRQ